MNMVGHQYVGIEEEGIAVLVAFQELEVFLVIGGAFKDSLPLIASCDDVIEGSRKLNSGLSYHDIKILKTQVNCQYLRFSSLTPKLTDS